MNTPAFIRFFVQSHETMKFFTIVMNSIPAMVALGKLPPDHEMRSEPAVRLADEILRRVAHDLPPATFDRVLAETWHSRQVDLFQQYLSEATISFLRKRPDCLRSKETIRLDEVLAHSSLDELVSTLAERRANSLAYASFADFVAFLEGHGVSVSGSEDQRNSVNEAIQVRNIIVHNRCLVNEIFVKRTGRQDIQIGTRYPLSPESHLATHDLLVAWAEGMDQALISHFSLTFRKDEFEGIFPRPDSH